MRSRKSSPSKWLFVGALITLSVGGYAKFKPAPDPLAKAWGMSLERNLDRLPEEGTLDEKNFPWADARFPFAEGSIANRYQREDLPKEDRFTRRGLRLDEIKALSPASRTEELSKHAPSEIFDLVRGYTATYPLTNEIRRLMAKAKSARDLAELDEKMSFGWAAAATSMEEPALRTNYKIRFPEGTEATLSIGSADVKGLAAYYYGVKVPNLVKIAKVGSRCHGANDFSCHGIDPASFHVLLTNMIKRSGKSFVADIDPSAAIDYRPIVGYTTAVRAEDDGSGYAVTTTVRYAKRRLPSAKPYGFFNLDSENETYKYVLETDKSHEITGGRWLSERRPEFVWRVKELPHVDHDGFGVLKDLYQEAPLLSPALSMF
ncbi:MAG: hypothetical protein JST04_09515 [Bdellovibrionales bacterium]|nr:hypothetical protein [Bdellovibrionales bacterium]